MSKDISNKLKQLVERIATDNNLKTTDIKYGSGSEVGDGFTANNIAVDINDADKSLHLFCKTNARTGWHDSLAVDNMFSNERYFYKMIYPAYQEFLKEKSIEDGFRNVPKCYGIDDDLIVLENLKVKGFDLFEKGITMNDEHIVLTMKTLAKFHAISFAFKDQKCDLYNNFIHNVISSCFTDMILQSGFNKSLASDMRSFLRSLDPVKDKDILDATGDLEKTLIDAILSIDKYICANPIIIQGDSWCNNMMYLYDRDNRETPVDLMVLDWQIIRNSSPVIDLSYFFYFIASEVALENLEYYLNVYYDELSKRMKQLGSDPEELYPLSTLKEEWKKFAKYSFGLGFFVVKTLVADKEDMAKFEEFPDLCAKLDKKGDVDIENIMIKITKEDLYYARMKMILKHFIKNNFLHY